MHTSIKLGAAIAAVTIVGILLATTAFAHATIGTVAWDNPSAPSRVIATSRGDDISSNPGTFSLTVTDANGNRVDLGNYTVVDAKRIAVGVKSDLPSGTYNVAWKTLSADDLEAAQGTLPLVLAGTAAAPAATVPASSGGPLAAPSTGDAGLAGGGSTNTVAFAAVAIGFAMIGSALLVRRVRQA